MFALRIFLLLVFLLVIWVFITQIAYPLYAHKPLFPFLRKRDPQIKALDKEVGDLHHKVTDLGEIRDLHRQKQSLNQEKENLEQSINSDSSNHSSN